MKLLSALLPAALLSALGANAQYCSPSFANGCFGWQLMNITLGSSMNWTNTDCSNGDQTATVAVVDAGSSISMTVEDGVWSGCSVWVDWDNSGSFEDAENLYHTYVGGDPSYTYNFSIDIPPGTPDGQYRMRVIGAWGSDGFTSGSENGFGPCGSFQYGSYDDFTLQVGTSTSIASLETSSASVLSASPNPTNGAITLSLGEHTGTPAQVELKSMDGRTLREWNATGAMTMDLDLCALPAGIYLLRNTADLNARPLRLVKQ